MTFTSFTIFKLYYSRSFAAITVALTIVMEPNNYKQMWYTYKNGAK